MYVVFFKQKTAYEMRISDWSSDVCSSDLTEVATLLGFMVQAGDAPFEHPERQPADMLVEVEALLEELHRRLSSRWFIDLPAQKIGRASSRVSVCQYG